MNLLSPYSADPIAVLSFWAGVAAFALTGILLLWLLFLRIWVMVQQRLRQNALLRWRPVLMSSLYELPDKFPRVSRSDLPHFLELWNHLYESLGVEAQNNLSLLANRAHIPAHVSRMLRQGNFSARLLAIRTAGNLRLVSAWEVLRDELACGRPALSPALARALILIDPVRALPLLMSYVAEHDDWDPVVMSEILRNAEASQAVKSLLLSFAQCKTTKAMQLLTLLAKLDPTAAAPQINRILASPSDDERLINTCLDLLNTSENLGAVRILAQHESWHIRVHAAKVLGRVGSPEDKALLTEMLADRQWWVRYRAAHALAQLSGINTVELLTIKDVQADRDARDMLHQVMAERGLWRDCMECVRG